MRSGLAGTSGPAARVEPAIRAVLDRRLLRRSPRPIAVALSGGGDSVALLLAAADWADRSGRRLLVLTVDHGLRPHSADWTKVCSARCTAMGQDFQGLRWVGEKPATGLPAAARDARHRLLADAARAAGARVILMGHTADDVREAQAMRAEGSTTPSPREWSASPVWPHGRGLFLLRPMLALGRTAIRDWLTARGERWIEDPANDDLTYARARARGRLAVDDAPGIAEPDTASIAGLARACREDEAGVLTIPRVAMRHAPSDATRRFVATACLCAAGTERPPLGSRARTLAERIAGQETFAGTLSGARVEADGQDVRFLREAGEMKRGGLQPMHLAQGSGVWDGRFEIEAGRLVEVRAMAGRMAGLPDSERAALSRFAARARPTLPQIVDSTGAAVSGASIGSLALARLRAACGVIEAEPA